MRGKQTYQTLRHSNGSGYSRMLSILFSCWTVIGILCFASTELLADEPLLLNADVFEGEPYGVGFVDLSRQEAKKRGWHFDQSIGINARHNGIWLPAVEEQDSPIIDQRDGSKPLVETEDRIKVYFIFSGKSPASIDIVFGHLRSTIATRNRSRAEHSIHMASWWKALCKQSHHGIPATLSSPTDDFLQVLSSHVGMPFARSKSERESTTESKLEKHFERTLSMLLGFESVRLAMMIDESPNELSRSKATFPLPAPIRIETVPVPSVVSKGLVPIETIETIATMVPEDCFYVRCKTVQNYSWLRTLLTNWGGSLDEVITNPTLESDIRRRLESQLGVDCQRCLDDGLDAHLTDMALIGSDMYFAEGAGIGVLFESKPGHENEVERILEDQREVASKNASAPFRSEKVNAKVVSAYVTEDNRMRSFYIRQGRFVLVTNSRAMTESFIGLSGSQRSLAHLNEYLYANATSPEARESDIKIYLSDPFFRRLTSPASRVEWERRRISALDCRQLEVSALIAKALGYPSDSVAALIQGKFLPSDFGTLADGSNIRMVSGSAVDSVRGRPGTFIPAADRVPDLVNMDEAAAYARFTTRYRREWMAMDPVLVSIRRGSVDRSMERVHLDIHVSPYARQAYAFLTNYLASPSSTHIAFDSKSLVGVSATLRNRVGNTLAYFGLCDDTIPFRIEHGVLIREGKSSKWSLVDKRSFAAVTPAGIEGLQLLSRLVEGLQTRDSSMGSQAPAPTNPGRSAQSRSVRALSNWMNPIGLLFQIGDELFISLVDLSKASSIYHDLRWSIYASNKEVRMEAKEHLTTQETNPTQIHLHAGGVEQSLAAPYLHAFSYCEARQKSAACAVWLTRWMNGLHCNPQTFRTSLEQALCARIVCPLGGEWRVDANKGTTAQWTSSAWQEESLAKVNSVPVGYRFPFLRWLQRIELDFNLKPNNLSSKVILDVSTDNANPLASTMQINQPTVLRERTTEKPEFQERNDPRVSNESKPIATMDRPLTNVKHMYKGKYAIAVGFDRNASIFDLKSQTPLQTLRGHTNTIWTVDVSPDNSMVVTGSEDRTLRFWEVKTGKELGQIAANGIYSCVRFSPDGRMVYATNWDGDLRVIDPNSRTLVKKFSYQMPILDVALLPNGDTLVLGTATGAILHCDLQTGKVKQRLEGHSSTVHSVAFVDSNRVLSASHDRTLRLWSLSSGLAERVFSGHTAAVHELRLFPTMDRFVSSSADGTARIWDLNSNRSVSVESLGHDVRGISISPDGSSILAACSDGKLRRIQLAEHP